MLRETGHLQGREIESMALDADAPDVAVRTYADAARRLDWNIGPGMQHLSVTVGIYAGGRA